MATAAVPDDDLEDRARQVETTIRYVDPGDFVTRRYVSQGKEMNTGTYSDHRVVVRDGTPIRDHFELDVHGTLLPQALAVGALGAVGVELLSRRVERRDPRPTAAVRPPG